METSTLNFIIVCGTILALAVILIGSGMILKFKEAKRAANAPSLLEQIIGKPPTK